MTDSVLLELHQISKYFGSTRALTSASLAVREGSVHALLGENGAGKTTLMRIAYGLVQPDAGTICVSGRRTILMSPADAIRGRIGMVHQHFSIAQAMTVAENVALGGRGRFNVRATAEQIDSISMATGMRLKPLDRAGSLGLPSQQQLEIVKALAQNARVLVLDEPTAVLAPAESTQLLIQLRMLADSGMAIVLITHKLGEALSIADEVTVLRRGSTVLSARASTLSRSLLADAMLGAEWSTGDRSSESGLGMLNERVLEEAKPRGLVPAAGTPVVRAIGVSIADDRGILRVRDLTLEVHTSEIIGIAGVEGAGVRELLRALSGRIPIRGGRLDRPTDVGFVPEDRHGEALALDLSLTENIALRNAGRRAGIVPWRAIRERTISLLDEFDITAPGPDARVRVLSGGNQQKLVLARELMGMPSLLIVENPTRGLDLRATAAVHARLRNARKAGMAIVLYSSDLDEILALADRSFAMYDGTLTETARDRGSIGQAMLGSERLTE